MIVILRNCLLTSSANDAPPVAVFATAGRLLVSLADLPSDLDTDQVIRTAIRIGLPREQVHPALNLLMEAGLARGIADVWRLEPVGVEVAHSLRAGEWSTFALRLLSASALRSQLARLIPLAHQAADGGAVVRRRAATAVAPQASILLSWLQRRTGIELAIPLEIVQLGSLEEPQELTPAWVEDRGRVGKRAEQYSLLFERLLHPPQLVLHVAAERDDMGYDIEDRSQAPPRAIEVKGSRSQNMKFMITKRELEEAHRRGANYELQFWGEIDLSRSIDLEYHELVRRGYPRRCRNLIEWLESDRLALSPIEWEVTEGRGDLDGLSDLEPGRGPG
jgi:hypothetical protein